jgi:hypothetical protein
VVLTRTLLRLIDAVHDLKSAQNRTHQASAAARARGELAAIRQGGPGRHQAVDVSGVRQQPRAGRGAAG